MNREVVAKNLIWRLAERSGAQGVNFLVSILLARLLLPEDYGIIAIVAVFIAIMQVFVDSGLGNALIQKKDADDIDFSTVFYFNMVACIVIYLLIYFIAPYVEIFYNYPNIASYIRVLGLTVLLSGVKNIQQAYVSRNMMFKRFFFATFGGTIISAIVGIILAKLGFGIWALIYQQLSNNLVDTLILWITVDWRPKRFFSFVRLKSLLSYGWKLLISALLETIYSNLRSIIIGKVFTSSDLAYYNRGSQFPSFIVSNTNSAIDSVLLPSMSYAQDDKVKIKSMVRRSIKTSSYLIWPIMIGLAIIAKPLVILLLTEKWLPCVKYLQLFCISYSFWPIHTANLNAIKAVGRSDLFLRIEILKKIIGIFSLIISVGFGVFAIAIAFTLTSPISAVINSKPNKELFDYSLAEQIKDIYPAFVCSTAMGITIIPLQLLISNIKMLLATQVIFGAMVYLILSKVFKIESYEYIRTFILKKDNCNV